MSQELNTQENPPADSPPQCLEAELHAPALMHHWELRPPGLIFQAAPPDIPVVSVSGMEHTNEYI